MHISTLIILLLMCFFIIVFIYLERKKISVKRISLIATMSALAGVSGIPFTALPNIQPVTFFIIITGYVFGPFFGFMTGMLAAAVLNTFLGYGPWTIWQMLSWAVVGFISGWLKKLIKRPQKLSLGIFAFLCGFLFGYIMNLLYWSFFVRPLSFESLAAVYAASFYFDLLHGLGNFGFAVLLGPGFIAVLSRFNKKVAGGGRGTFRVPH